VLASDLNEALLKPGGGLLVVKERTSDAEAKPGTRRRDGQ
jgi:hypothetical protein